MTGPPDDLGSTVAFQLAYAARFLTSRRDLRDFTVDDLRATLEDRFKAQLEPWKTRFARLVGWGVFREQAGRDRVTPDGQTHLDDVIAEDFGRIPLSVALSPAYAAFCREVDGRDLSQLSMADMPQLDALLSTLQLRPDDRALDVAVAWAA